MRPWLLFALVATLAYGLADLAARAPGALAKLEAFRVRELDIQGNRFLSDQEVEGLLSLDSLASVWDDLDGMEDRLRTHPLVEEARVTRRFPGTLRLRLRERNPVALVPSPTLEPVDASGRLLPIDPAVHRLDLPLITRGRGNRAEPLSPAERNMVAGEIARMAQGDPGFLARVSEVALEPRGDLRAEVYDPRMTMLFRPYLPSRRIQEGIRVLGDAMSRFQGAGIANLDLRYEDQVVVRLIRAEGN